MLKKYQLGSQPASDMSGTTEGETYRTPVSERPLFTGTKDLSGFLEPLTTSVETTDSPVPKASLQELEKVTDAINMDTDSFFFKYNGELPQETLVSEKVKKEKVPLERIAGESLAPNIYRENRSAVIWNGKSVEECAAGMQLAMISSETPGHISHNERKALGIYGNAWHVGDNVLRAGGSRIYGLHENTAGLSNSSKMRAKLLSNRSDIDLDVIYDTARTGDLVEMYYPDSGSQSEAAMTGRGTYTTHIGMLSTDATGKKYVTHNIHGTWHTDDLASVLTNNGKGKWFVSGIVRPAYEQTSNAIEVRGERHIKRSTGNPEPIERTPEEIKEWSDRFQKRRNRVQPFISGLEYYAPYVQEDMQISNNDMKDLVIPVSYALFGNESAFNDPENKVQFRIKNRELIRGVKNIGRSIGVDAIAPGIFDPMSEGPTQIKLEETFGSENGKELLTRYGIDEGTIYDVSMSAAATQLLTAYNLKKLRGFIGAGRFDALDLQTKRNLLLKAHNKGVDAVIQRDLMDGVSKGLKTYSRLHIQDIPEDTPDDQKAFMRYTNTGNDYALELNVDYEKILKNREEADRMGYNIRPLPTLTEELAQETEETFSTLKTDAYSTLKEGKEGLQNIAVKGKKLYEDQGKKKIKTIATSSEVAGERLFAEMLRLGTIAGEKGESLQGDLNAVTATAQDTAKAISQDMQRAAEAIDMDPMDVKEHIARQTFENKIPKKITELSDAAERVGSAMAAPRYRLQEFNAFMEMEGISIPMSVQQKIMLDPRFQDGLISLKDLIEEYLGKSTGIPSASVDSIPAPDNRLADLLIGSEQIPQMKYGGALPDLPKYQNGTPEILTDKNEYERRNRVHQAYSDSLAAYNNQKEIFNLAQRSNWSSGSGRGNRVPLFNPLGLPIDTYEEAYNASVPLNQIVGGLPYSGRDQYENIKPAGYLNQYDTQSGNAVKIFPFYKKPVQPVQPVIYRKPEPTMAIPRMEVEEKPEWFKQKRMIERMREYKKPEQPKRKYTATLQGVQGLQ